MKIHNCQRIWLLFFSFLNSLKLFLVIVIDCFLNLSLISYLAFKDKYCRKSYNRKVCVKEPLKCLWITSNQHPARVQFHCLKHGVLLPFAAASQHSVTPQCGSVLVSGEVLLSWMETKYCFLDKIPDVPWPLSFWTKKKDKGVTFFSRQK